MSMALIIGGSLFLVSLLVGAVASVRNIQGAHGPRERAYVVRICGFSWIVILSMLVCAYWLTAPLIYFVVAAYFVITPVLFYRWATRHQLIRMIESRDRDEGKTA